LDTINSWLLTTCSDKLLGSAAAAAVAAAAAGDACRVTSHTSHTPRSCPAGTRLLLLLSRVLSADSTQRMWPAPATKQHTQVGWQHDTSHMHTLTRHT
jgi:hypothetical protein